MTKRSGQVTWFCERKGYGEIFGDDQKVYHVSYQGIKSRKKIKSLSRDQKVEFVANNKIPSIFGLPVADGVRVQK